MSTTLGGSARVLWTSATKANVKITNQDGGAVAFTVDGAAVTFPYVMSASTTFDTALPGRYLISVRNLGREVLTTAGTPWELRLESGVQAILQPGVAAPGTPTGATITSGDSANTAEGDVLHIIANEAAEGRGYLWSLADKRFAWSATGLGFYGTEPVAKPAALTASAAAAPAGGTGAAAGGWDTAANRDAAIATINNLKTRVDELEAKIKALGLLA